MGHYDLQAAQQHLVNPNISLSRHNLESRIVTMISNSLIAPPTEKQREIYRYWESKENCEADEIYSQEWTRRAQDFLTQRSDLDKTTTALNAWEKLENLEFGALFLAYPIQAYALYCLLESCYALDHTICGSGRDDAEVINQWRRMKPFAYLKARKVREKWRKSLNKLKVRIKTKKLGGAALIDELHGILSGMQRLEAQWGALQSSMNDLLPADFRERMLERVSTAVNKRCEIIASELGSGGRKNQEQESESEETLANSFSDLAASPDVESTKGNQSESFEEDDEVEVHYHPPRRSDSFERASQVGVIAVLIAVVFSFWGQT